MAAIYVFTTQIITLQLAPYTTITMTAVSHVCDMWLLLLSMLARFDERTLRMHHITHHTSQQLTAEVVFFAGRLFLMLLINEYYEILNKIKKTFGSNILIR